jgi:DNA helicase-2/ATP-dependent DNA helicase PcrA
VRERWESLAALVRLAEEFELAQHAAQQLADLAAYVVELDTRAAAQHAPAVEGVTLASLHSAKGLEWDAVFLVGLTEGMMPITYAKTDEQIEEERRLLYVGVTRAREHLGLSWALARSPGGRASRSPSRFLDGLRPGSSARTGARGAGRVGAGGAVREPGARGSRARAPLKCRVCGRVLTEAVERKLRRCEDCPSSLDEALYERLREWRGRAAREQDLPAYCIFTDATLIAIAEEPPGSLAELGQISGVGRAKLDKYGDVVLSLCGGADSPSEQGDISDLWDESGAFADSPEK